MRSTWWTRGGRAGGILAMLLLAVGVPAASGKPGPVKPAKRSGIALFALAFNVMNTNSIYCGINNRGEVCVDPTDSPVLEGGFWPKGSPDSYIFNSGLQLAGTIPLNAAFPWAGDTVGAFFMDPRGDQRHGAGVTAVFNSLDPADQVAWPQDAYVRDTNIYHPILVAGADSGLLKQDGSGINVSQQDLWTLSWEGDPANLSGRKHPMGILVEERGMSWNFPTGNEDIIYWVYTFYNVTADGTAGVCDTLYKRTIDKEHYDAVRQVGANFQSINEAKFGINIPACGYPITNMYAAFFMDADVGVLATLNYSTPVIPFAMGVAYKADFLEPTWYFPPDKFGSPFVPSPGFVGAKYLRSPVDSAGNQIGLTIWGNTDNPTAAAPAHYGDPVGIWQLYRYLSGTSDPKYGDGTCSFQGQQLELHFCYQSQTALDTRFFQSSGPMSLKPGEAKTIVMAYILAAPVGTPTLLATIGGDFKPGIPASGDSMAADPSRVRDIEHAMGWVSQADTNGDQKIEQYEVSTVPKSLLNKALVAQAVYDNRFLLPFAPAPPTFFLVPGNNQVTIAWQKSATELPGGGDPFYAIASDPLSKLYDPNFRHFDVEGYRIYRGRTTGNLDLIAQFDYAGTQIVDYTGDFAYTTDLSGNGISACAPELGVFEDCPVHFDTAPPYTVSYPHDLVGNVIQVPLGGRVKLANGGILILKADTAVTGGGKFPPLVDNGVTFAYVDRGVLNSFTYYYAVTAFDVNSVTSGPSSLESARVTKQTTPRVAGANTSSVVLVQGEYGSDGTQLDLNAQYPAINTSNGTFSGNMPPGNAAALILGSAVNEALPQGDIAVTIDSMTPGFQSGIGGQPSMYLTMSAGGSVIKRVVPLTMPSFSATGNTNYQFDQALVPYDSANAKRFGIAFTQDVRMPITFGDSLTPLSRHSYGEALIIGRYGVGGTNENRYLAHSRWFDPGAGEPPNPTVMGYADSAHHAGKLTGVGRIWSPQNHRDTKTDGTAGPQGAANILLRGYGYANTAWYPADYLVTWNADSSVTVFDSTHHTVLPFTAQQGTGYGFLNVRTYADSGVAAGDIADGTGAPSVGVAGYHHLYLTYPTCLPDWWGPAPCVDLERTAQYEPLSLTITGAQNASGIVLIINGEPFFMEMSGIPAAGTKWRLRAVSGNLSATSCSPELGPVMTGCTGYSFTGVAVRPSYAPGLTYKITVAQKYAVADNTSGDLSRVHTVPDPYYVTTSLEATPSTKLLKFVHLPSRAIIRIYSVSGILVNVVTHNDPGGAGEATWNLRNRNNQFVASGVYFYHVEGPDGKTKVGRFTVVNFAP
ncbi:MAG TPA: hypothetical protein VMH88_09865 [Gemmatimonadales bacterium]|nr:hypothetical protein [Gemmatimonadales bacterium]